MSPKIERIEIVGPDRRARRLVFDEPDHARTTSAAAIRSLGLEPGDSVALGAIEEAERPLAHDRALKYLEYRDRSHQEVLSRLLDDGYPDELAHSIVARLVELGFVEDRRFAHAWARARARAGYGSRRIERELRERGIDECLAQRAVADACDDPVASARRVLRGKTATSHAQRERLLRKLIQRGFDFAVAREALADSSVLDDEVEPFVGE